MAILEAKQIHYAYPTAEGQLEILRGLDLNVEAGEFVAIQGPSGSGKSTLLHILGGMARADKGQLIIDSCDVAELSGDELALLRNQKLGFIFQNFQLMPRLTVLENILLPTQYPVESSNTTAADHDKALQIAEYLGLSERLHHLPSELSGGQQQRVAIARALMRGSRILLADEPTGNLDSQSTEHILRLLKQLNQQGISIILITHDAHVAEQADRVVHFKDGAIDTIVQNTSKSSVAASTASASINWQKGTASRFGLLRRLLPLATVNILRHKLRSSLTMLGIVIGIAAVLAMSTLGNFTKDNILASYSNLGVNTLLIRGNVNWFLRATDQVSVTYRSFDKANDLDPLPRIFPEIKQLSPILRSWNTPISYGGRSVEQGVISYGVDRSYLSIVQHALRVGKNFSPFHIDSRNGVCIIGNDIAEQLFINADPIGQLVQLKMGDNPIMCRVIGVLEAIQTNEERADPNLAVLLPYTFFQSVADNEWSRGIHRFVVDLQPGSDIERVGNAINNFLSKKYGISGRFTIGADGVLLQQMNNFLNMFTLLLIMMAMISLTVGGIGISNMMLVSVSERIKEIGLRKALGATHRSMRMQLLTESVLLCCTAGVIGLLLGFICYQSVIYAAARFFEQVEFQWVVNLPAIILSVISMLVVGIISGLLPAIKAESLDIVDALRHE